MRVATFNLESLDEPPRAAVTLNDRIAILRPQLERLRADILCLQEINGQRVPGSSRRSLVALDRLLAGTRYETFARAETAAADGEGAADVHNLVVLSQWPIARFRCVRNTFVPPMAYRPLTADPPETKPQEIRFERPIA
jgi:endonuclease/exonuclease/phosphatase family metal-dependent hydrolase